jgi:hypothetical protein
LIHRAEQLLPGDPASAAKHLHSARHYVQSGNRSKALNPRLTDKISTLQNTADKALSELDTLKIINQIKQMAAAGKPYQALMAIYARQRAGDGSDNSSELIAQLNSLWQGITIVMDKLEHSAVGLGALHNIHFYNTNHLAIGRSSDRQLSTLILGYKRLSRGSKQNLLSRRGNDFFISDTGSSNGSWLNGQLLPEHTPVPLTNDSVVAMGGQRSPEQIGLCQLHIQLPVKSPGAVIIKLQRGLTVLLDKSMLATCWPTINADQHKVTILPGDALVMGLNNKGGIDFACSDGIQPAAVLCFKAGLQIKPLANHCLQIDGVEIVTQVPVACGAEVKLDGKTMSFGR